MYRHEARTQHVLRHLPGPAHCGAPYCRKPGPLHETVWLGSAAALIGSARFFTDPKWRQVSPHPGARSAVASLQRRLPWQRASNLHSLCDYVMPPADSVDVVDETLRALRQVIDKIHTKT